MGLLKSLTSMSSCPPSHTLQAWRPHRSATSVVELMPTYSGAAPDFKINTSVPLFLTTMLLQFLLMAPP
jgi:hypothetical protein